MRRRCLVYCAYDASRYIKREKWVLYIGILRPENSMALPDGKDYMLRSLLLVTSLGRNVSILSAGFPKCTTYQTRLNCRPKGPVCIQGLCSALGPRPILSGCAPPNGGF